MFDPPDQQKIVGDAGRACWLSCSTNWRCSAFDQRESCPPAAAPRARQPRAAAALAAGQRARPAARRPGCSSRRSRPTPPCSSCRWPWPPAVIEPHSAICASSAMRPARRNSRRRRSARPGRCSVDGGVFAAHAFRRRSRAHARRLLASSYRPSAPCVQHMIAEHARVVRIVGDQDHRHMQAALQVIEFVAHALRAAPDRARRTARPAAARAAAPPARAPARCAGAGRRRARAGNWCATGVRSNASSQWSTAASLRPARAD